MRSGDEAIVARDAMAFDDLGQVGQKLSELGKLCRIGRMRMCTASGSPMATGSIAAW